MLKAVLFDIDDTLYSYVQAHSQAIVIAGRYAEQELGISCNTFCCEVEQAMRRQFAEHPETAGCHSRAIRFQMVLEKLGLPLRYAFLLNDLYWNELIRVSAPFPLARETLLTLKAKGLKLGTATDMTADWQLKKLDHLQLLDLFDFVVTSEEAAVEKPDRRIFELCARKAGCRLDECLMVGDNLKKDVLGAQSAGLQALWLQPDPEKAAQFPCVKSIPTLNGLIHYI